MLNKKESTVTERIGLEIKTNSFNKNYINTKINKAGHIKN